MQAWGSCGSPRAAPAGAGRPRKKALAFLLAAEAHHALDAGAVLPAAVEQHDLAPGKLRSVFQR